MSTAGFLFRLSLEVLWPRRSHSQDRPSFLTGAPSRVNKVNGHMRMVGFTPVVRVTGLVCSALACHAPSAMPMTSYVERLITTSSGRLSVVFHSTTVTVLLAFTSGTMGGFTACPVGGVVFVPLDSTSLHTYIICGRIDISLCLTARRPVEVTSRVTCPDNPLPDALLARPPEVVGLLACMEFGWVEVITLQ